MREDIRAKVGRLAVFLLSVVIFSIFLGVILGKLPIEPEMRRPVAIGGTLACVAIAYLVSYRPGWLYNSLTEPQEEAHQDH